MLIRNGLVYCTDFRFHRKDIRVEDGFIRELSDDLLPGGSDGSADNDGLMPFEQEEVLDADGLYVLPGLTDLHFHGAVNEDVSDGNPEGIAAIARYEYEHGVTQICPATMTVSEDKITAACKAAAAYRRTQETAGAADSRAARIVGLHLEGPFLSPERAGAQNPKYLLKPDVAKLQSWIDASEGLVKTVTIAPELEGTLDCIAQLRDQIAFSVGHTTADYDTAKRAFEAGAVRLTHTCNAMPGFLHRAPGPIAAGWENENVSAEVIGDGVHLHPAMVKALFRLFGAERVILISDSIRLCGMPDGRAYLGGQPVIKKNGEIRLPNGVLAGSVVNLYEGTVRTIRMGVAPEDAIRAAAYNPAAALGIEDRYGSIAVGKTARLVLARQDWSIERVL